LRRGEDENLSREGGQNMDNGRDLRLFATSSLASENVIESAFSYARVIQSAP